MRAPAHRSFAGLVIAAVILPPALALLACIRFPVGDPETSRIDPELSGVWIGAERDETYLLVFRPFDARTYLVTLLQTTGEQSPDAQASAAASSDAPPTDALLARMLDDTHAPDGAGAYKAWLTPMGGRRLLCMEPLWPIDQESGFQIGAWLLFRVDTLSPDVVTLRFPPNLGREGGLPLDAANTQQETEDILRANVDRDESWVPWRTYARVKPDRYSDIERVFKRFKLAIDD